MTKEQTRERKNEIQKKYYHAHREKLLAYAAAYRRNNPERTASSVKACQTRIKKLREEIARQQARLAITLRRTKREEKARRDKIKDEIKRRCAKPYTRKELLEKYHKNR